MKFFIDTGDVGEIREAASMGLVDGVTTNPTLIAKSGRKYRDVVVEICELVNGPISAEVLTTAYADMMKEARDWHTVHKNVVVKFPMTLDGTKALRSCVQQGIPVNMTLCFSPNQALIAAKAGASFISPFIGRIDDISETGMDLVRKIVTIYRNYQFKTSVLVASVRSPVHVVEAALAGADACTIPFKVIEQLLQHPLTDVGLEKFGADAAKIPR